MKKKFLIYILWGFNHNNSSQTIKIINTHFSQYKMILQLSNLAPSNLIGSFNTTIISLSKAVLTFVFGFILGKIVERVLFKVLKEIEINKIIKDATKLKINADHLISHFISYVIYFLAFVAALEQLGLANTILYLLSGAIILFILISFFLAIRDFIPNLMAGIYLYSKEKVKEGKYVEIDNIKGELLHVDLLQLKIQTKNGDILHIPNSTAMKSKIKIRKRKP